MKSPYQRTDCCRNAMFDTSLDKPFLTSTLPKHSPNLFKSILESPEHVKTPIKKEPYAHIVGRKTTILHFLLIIL